MLTTANYDSPVGRVLLAANDDALVGLWMEGQKYYPDALKAEQTGKNDHPVLVQAMAWLDRYFAGERPTISELSLSPTGSDFRQAVWAVLCEIPYGETTTYGEVAHKVARILGKERMSAQAVGGAIGHNAISIIIPCHRVVGATGSLTGYAGGMDQKRYLLAHEGVDTAGLFVPNHSTAP